VADEIPIGTGVLQLEARGKEKLVRDAEDARRQVETKLNATSTGGGRGAGGRGKVPWAVEVTAAKFGLLNTAMEAFKTTTAAAGATLAMAFGAVGTVRRLAGMAAPASGERFDRASNDLQASIGRALIPALDGLADKLRTYADAIAGNEGKLKRGFNDANAFLYKYTRTVMPLFRIADDFMTRQGAKHKGASIGAAYDERMGRSFGGDDLFKAVQSEALKEPLRPAEDAAAQAKEQTGLLRDIRDALVIRQPGVKDAAPTLLGSPVAAVAQIGATLWEKFKPGD
jgi:hypothetical protein